MRIVHSLLLSLTTNQVVLAVIPCWEKYALRFPLKASWKP
jgi:hypothetical protein